MTKRIVILGGGTGGTLTANRLHRHFRHHRSEHQPVEIVVVDQDDHHVYQPGLLFVPFGLAHAAGDRAAPPARSCTTTSSSSSRPSTASTSTRDTVVLDDGRELAYDVLVIATGATLALDETEGLTGPGWNEKVFTFYDLAGATALEAALDRVRGRQARRQRRRHADQVPGRPARVLLPRRLVLHRARHPRQGASITYATPLDGAFTKPVASAALGGLLAEKGIDLVTEFNTGEVVERRAAARQAGRLRRPRGAVRPGGGRAAAQRRRRTSAAARASATTSTSCPPTSARCRATAKRERVRHRRRHQRAHLQGRLGHPLRGRGAGRQHHPLPRRTSELDEQLRRPRQLLHRDRLRQGPADRLQLRDRTAARATSPPPSACRC